MSGIRGGKLKLKGDKTRPSSNPTSSLSRSLPSSTTTKGDQGKTLKQVPRWTTADSISKLTGPIVVLALYEKEIFLVACEDTGVVKGRSVREVNLENTLGLIEPNDVSQVLVGQSLIQGQYCLKSAFGKYLSCDPFGAVSASKEAVGPTEEWTPIKVDDGFAFKNAFGKFLSVEKDTGKVRADSISIESNETFHIRCQLTSSETTTLGRNDNDYPSSRQDLNLLEENEARKFVSWGGKRIKMKQLGESEISIADKEGRLYETLLEKRIKSKHDPFC